MTWRPSAFLLEGELDNRIAGRIIGWLRFAGLPEKVTLDLEGDFGPDVRGGRIAFKSIYRGEQAAAAAYMAGFDPRQTGRAGHITTGGPPHIPADFPLVEWHSDQNDRVVLYLEPHQVMILDPPAEPAAAQATGP